MKRILLFITAIFVSLTAFSCIVSDDDTSSKSSTETTTSSASGSSFTASNKIYIDLTNAKVSSNNTTWSAITTSSVDFFEDDDGNATVKVKCTQDSNGDSTGVIRVDAEDATANLAVYLTGTQTTGSVKIQTSTDYEVGVYLTDVTITSTNYPCIDITKGGAATVFISGTNSLTDGRKYGSDYSEYSDNKGTLFCKGGLALCDKDGSSGSAKLNITQNYKSCIASKENLLIQSGTYTLNSTAVAVYDSSESDFNSPACLKADGNLVISGGTVTGSASGNGSKGIKVGGTYTQSSGTVNVSATGKNLIYKSGTSSAATSISDSEKKSYTTTAAKGVRVAGAISISGGTLYGNSTYNEAIESKSTIDITGGEVYGYSGNDDGINSSSTFTINDGYVCGYAPGNDGLDANGNFYIKGGVVFAVGSKSPEVAIDANTEGGYKLYVSGGTIMTVGPLEGGSSLSQSCYKASSWNANTKYCLTVGSNTYVFITPENTSSYGSGIVVSGSSTPNLLSGVTVSGGTTYFDDVGAVVVDGTVSGGSSVTLSSYTASSGNGGGGPGGNGGRP